MRADKQEQELKFNRRTLIMAAGGAGMFVALGARLYSLQVMETERYRLLSDNNQFNFLLDPPIRGRLTDRFGEILADNRDSYRIVIVPEQAGDLTEALQRLASIVRISPAEQERIFAAARRGPHFRPVTVAEDLDWDTFAAVNLRAPELAGVTPDVVQIRHYPSGPAFGHVLGYVQPASEEMAGNDRLLRHPGFRIGRSGVELARESDLRGAAGSRKVEVNAFGRIVRELPDQSIRPTQGADVALTLDAEVQRYAYERLAEESAAVVAMDVRNGDILALVSTPGFDPNSFVRGISHNEFQGLQADERRPLFNKALQGTYPPASTYKAVVALAALEAGVMTTRDRVTCRGHIELGGRRFHCWRRGGHGSVNMHDAVKTSCDVFFYEAASRLGIARIHDMSLRFGLGPAPDIGLPGVRDGVVPNAQWKRARFGQAWTGGETLITGIGQGFLLTSPLQLAVMTARLASGRYVEPRLYRDAPIRSGEPISMNDGNFAFIRNALRAVVHEPGGTSFYGLSGGLGIPGVEMAGKTGTAQVYSITPREREAGVRTQAQLPWRLRDHGLFICYAPADEPKYAVVTVVEHGGGGSASAARPARDILRRLIERDPAAREGQLAALDMPAGGGR